MKRILLAVLVLSMCSSVYAEDSYSFKTDIVIAEKEVSDLEKPIVKTYTEEKQRVFSISSLERQISNLDSDIERINAEKAKLQAEIAEAKLALNIKE